MSWYYRTLLRAVYTSGLIRQAVVELKDLSTEIEWDRVASMFYFPRVVQGEKDEKKNK